MKKIKFWGLLLGVLLLAAGCGDAQEQTASVAPVDNISATTEVTKQENGIKKEISSDVLYTEKIDEITAYLSNEPDIANLGESLDGQTGIWEVYMGMGKAALASLGYFQGDLSGDGIPELVIAEMPFPDAETTTSAAVLNLYTCAGNTVVPLFEGWSRNRWYWLENGEWLNEGSSGVMNSMIARYRFTEDGKSLQCEDCFFTAEKAGNAGKVDVYHNTSGDWNLTESEIIESSAEDFYNQTVEWEQQIQDIELISFQKYQENRLHADIQVQWVEELAGELPQHEEFVADNDEPQSEVLISAVNPVKDFKVLRLEVQDVDENGQATFAQNELYRLDTLTMEMPLLIRFTFYGDLPSYGISYIDGTGNPQCFSLGISGEDGSLLLTAL